MYLSFRIFLNFKVFSFCLLLLLGAIGEGYGQTKVLANEATFASPNVPRTLLENLGIGAPSQRTVENSTNATNEQNTFARLNASPGLLAGLGAFGGTLELKFPGAKIPGGTTTYIKLNASDNLLSALLGGSLGNVLNSLLSTVALGAHVFTIQARDGNTVVYTANSLNQFNGTNAKVISDKDGDIYLSITPSLDYDRIRISNETTSLLGLSILQNPKTLDIYQAFYISNSSDCSSFEFTSFDGTGLTLDLLNLGGAGVANSHYAIDDNVNTASEIGVGVLGVAASMSQYIYLSKPSTIGDGFNVTLQINNSALLNLGLGDGIVVRAWSGTGATPVFEQAFNESNLLGLINLDLLNLLKSGEPVTVPFSPSVTFDRIEIAVNTTVNASIPRIVNVYDIDIITAKPQAEPDTFHICSGDTAQLAVTTQSPRLRWYLTSDAVDHEIETDSDESYNVSPTANTTFWVSAANACNESERVPINVVVYPKPPAPHITAN